MLAAFAAAATGWLACCLQVTAKSHSSIPQFQAWLHPLSPLSPPPPPPLALHNHLPFSLNLHSSSKLLLFRKDPSVPPAAWLGAKHLCGCGWPTLPGSQVAVAPNPPRSALSVSQTRASPPVQLARASLETQPGQFGIRMGPLLTPTRSATQTQPAKCTLMFLLLKP